MKKLSTEYLEGFDEDASILGPVLVCDEAHYVANNDGNLTLNNVHRKVRRPSTLFRNEVTADDFLNAYERLGQVLAQARPGLFDAWFTGSSAIDEESIDELLKAFKNSAEDYGDSHSRVVTLRSPTSSLEANIIHDTEYPSLLVYRCSGLDKGTYYGLKEHFSNPPKGFVQGYFPVGLSEFS